MRRLILTVATIASFAALLVGVWSIWLASRTAAPASSAPAQGAHCRYRDNGLLPDPRCTPGATNPAVTQSNIYSTICKSGWAESVRPDEYVTEPQKYRAYGIYGLPESVKTEYDHLVPLEVGGATDSQENLWPETYPGAAEKDKLENTLNAMVCDDKISLSSAQQIFEDNWVSGYNLYDGGNLTP